MLKPIPRLQTKIDILALIVPTFFYIFQIPGIRTDVFVSFTAFEFELYYKHRNETRTRIIQIHKTL